jgi:two-component system, OmpR family, sensor kinase
MKLRPSLSWDGPPLALQIMALLLGGLVAAQLVTLFLTLILPPVPQPEYDLADVAAVLRGAEDQSRGAYRLRREVQAGSPQVAGPGWLESDKSRRELARLAGVDTDQVVLAFYTPLPFAGTAVPRNYAMANDGIAASFNGAAGVRPAALLLAQYAPPPPPASGGAMPGQASGGLQPGSRQWPPGGMRMPNGAGRQGMPRDAGGNPPSGGGIMRQGTRPTLRDLQPEGSVMDRRQSGGDLRALPSGAPTERSGVPSTYGPPRPQGGQRMIQPPLLVPPSGAVTLTPAPAVPLPRDTQNDPVVSAPTPRSEERPVRVPVPAAPLQIAPAPQRADTSPDVAPTNPVRSTEAPLPAPAGDPIVVTPRRALFGLAPAPFVQGDFVAGLRLPDGRWAVVHPAAAGPLDPWQRRVLLWFALSLALVAPFGWLFARRLVKPLKGFARAAEQLGRDPSAAIGVLDGPAEIGRAAHAFNQMQSRLRSFVDDRTAMIGAISHDLRTPLTRMRFRIEDVPDEVRDGLLEEVDEMEAMIAQVIAFIRDASTPGVRERLDLRTLIDDVVEDARLVGGDVQVDTAEPAPVEVDVLGMRRLLDNLLENAVKYGARARVRLTTDIDTAVAEIIDEGPGMPDEELERAFQPFYRTQSAQASAKSGSGLGLAVCRSIARAHGGDVRLINAPDGFCAQVRVPLAYGAELAA